jgi:hypothetical protein
MVTFQSEQGWKLLRPAAFSLAPVKRMVDRVVEGVFHNLE